MKTPQLLGRARLFPVRAEKTEAMLPHEQHEYHDPSKLDDIEEALRWNSSTLSPHIIGLEPRFFPSDSLNNPYSTSVNVISFHRLVNFQCIAEDRRTSISLSQMPLQLDLGRLRTC